MRDRLKVALLARRPQMKDNLAGRYVDKYVTEVMAEIATRHMLLSKEEAADGEMNFAANAVNAACGRYKDGGTVGYIYTLMQEHPSTALVVSVYTGNSLSNRVSRVIINPQYKREIMNALASNTIECDPAHLRKIQQQANRRMEIDAESLASYIQQTRIDLRKQLDEEYEATLVRNLQIAKQLLDMAYEVESVCYVDEYWNEIDSGRMHGHGLSLQRIPKAVRHAALGRCYRYDFKAASYALMTALAMQINPTIKTAALQEYIRYRSVIRKRIAADIGVSDDWMKRIFTAMGFGAELKDNPHNVIRKELGRLKYHKLLCNTEFMLISQQLKHVSEAILQEVGTGDFEWLGKTYTEVNPKDGRKRSKNQKLAWLYQVMETDAMKLFVGLIPVQCKIKLQVHDCVYLDRPLPERCVLDIKWAMQERYALLNFERDEIIPIHTADYVSKIDRSWGVQAAAHKTFIAEQEAIAKDWIAPDSE